MDREIVIEKFDEIEQKVERLIEDSRRLRTENAELVQQNEQLQLQIQELSARESQAQEVKTLIRSKIDSLVNRLDGIAET